MSLILLASPAAEPLTLAEAKHFLRVEHADDDALIAALIVGARGHVEAATRRALLTQTWRLIADAWPADGRIEVLLAPLREVAAARVFGTSGAAHALDTEAFVLDVSASPGVIAFPPWAVAVPGRAVSGIEIDIIAGYGDDPSDVPEPLRHAVRLLVVHWYENRGVAVEGAARPMPAGLDALLAPFRGITL